MGQESTTAVTQNNNAYVVIINNARTSYDLKADLIIQGQIEEIVPKIVKYRVTINMLTIFIYISFGLEFIKSFIIISRFLSEMRL